MKQVIEVMGELWKAHRRIWIIIALFTVIWCWAGVRTIDWLGWPQSRDVRTALFMSAQFVLFHFAIRAIFRFLEPRLKG
ncbi:hypothetical protein EON81_12700 [bacterium]|nr:MAG: hypothetical protein EON81_12700 [bacterium]